MKPLSFTAKQLMERDPAPEEAVKTIVFEYLQWAKSIKRSDKIPDYVVHTVGRSVADFARRSGFDKTYLHEWEAALILAETRMEEAGK